MTAKVHIIDQDPHYHERVSAIASTVGLDPVIHASGESFLSQFSPNDTGCVVSELRLCGISGLELLDHLESTNSCMPLFFLTAHAKTSSTVSAMQRGALTVLDKPIDEDEVWNALRRGMIESQARKRAATKRADIQQRFASLTDNEARLAELIVQGKTNREIAEQHRVSVRTIEARRQKTYAKLGVTNLPELVELSCKRRSLQWNDREAFPPAPTIHFQQDRTFAPAVSSASVPT